MKPVQGKYLRRGSQIQFCSGPQKGLEQHCCKQLSVSCDTGVPTLCQAHTKPGQGSSGYTDVSTPCQAHRSTWQHTLKLLVMLVCLYIHHHHHHHLVEWLWGGHRGPWPPPEDSWGHHGPPPNKILRKQTKCHLAKWIALYEHCTHNT